MLHARLLCLHWVLDFKVEPCNYLPHVNLALFGLVLTQAHREDIAVGSDKFPESWLIPEATCHRKQWLVEAGKDKHHLQIMTERLSKLTTELVDSIRTEFLLDLGPVHESQVLVEMLQGDMIRNIVGQVQLEPHRCSFFEFGLHDKVMVKINMSRRAKL